MKSSLDPAGWHLNGTLLSLTPTMHRTGIAPILDRYKEAEEFLVIAKADSDNFLTPIMPEGSLEIGSDALLKIAMYFAVGDRPTGWGKYLARLKKSVEYSETTLQEIEPLNIPSEDTQFILTKSYCGLKFLLRQQRRTTVWKLREAAFLDGYSNLVTLFGSKATNKFVDEIAHSVRLCEFVLGGTKTAEIDWQARFRKTMALSEQYPNTSDQAAIDSFMKRLGATLRSRRIGMIPTISFPRMCPISRTIRINPLYLRDSHSRLQPKDLADNLEFELDNHDPKRLQPDQPNDSILSVLMKIPVSLLQPMAKVYQATQRKGRP